MATLRDALPVTGMVGQPVAFHQSDRVVELRKHPRRKQTRHARAQNDGVLPVRR